MPKLYQVRSNFTSIYNLQPSQSHLVHLNPLHSDWLISQLISLCIILSPLFHNSQCPIASNLYFRTRHFTNLNMPLYFIQCQHHLQLVFHPCRYKTRLSIRLQRQRCFHSARFRLQQRPLHTLDNIIGPIVVHHQVTTNISTNTGLGEASQRPLLITTPA